VAVLVDWSSEQSGRRASQSWEEDDDEMRLAPLSLSLHTTAEATMELALLFFLSALAVTLIDWIGSDALASLVRPPLLLPLLHPASRFLPRSPHNLLTLHRTQFYTPFAPAGTSTRAKKAEILQLRADLAATSSQDEFSKWARIRRKLDKAVQDLDNTTADTSQHRKHFNKQFKSALWIVTTVAPFVVSSYHRKSPVFWLPRGWFGPLGWWLSFPSAPAGASLAPLPSLPAALAHAQSSPGPRRPRYGCAVLAPLR